MTVSKKGGFLFFFPVPFVDYSQLLPRIDIDDHDARNYKSGGILKCGIQWCGSEIDGEVENILFSDIWGAFYLAY